MPGNINIKLRPIKIAFLVDPTDEPSILEAIRISTFLWGGAYNSIIPVLKRIPPVWKKNDPFINFHQTAKEITAGYIEAFDPDFYVVLGCDTSHLDIDKERIISARKILSAAENDGTPSYGIGLFEILKYFIERELKYVRCNPIDISFTQLDAKSHLFLASVFGELPEKLENIFRENYLDQLGASKVKVSLNNYSTLLKPEKLFLRRFSTLYVDATPSTRAEGACIFFLDAENAYDVIDYWNLRAMGWTVIPIPKQSAMNEGVKQLARDFIDEHFNVSRNNPQYFHRTTIIKARSVEMETMKEFIKNLEILPESKDNPHAYKFVVQGWYPKMWSEWARDTDGVAGCDLDAGEKNEQLSESNENLSIKTLDPKFIARFGGQGDPRFVNVLSFRIFRGDNMFAQVIPPVKGWEMVRAIDGIEPDAWRFSHRELIYLSSHADWTINFSIPAAEEVFGAWLRSQGWKEEISSPGKIATQMIRQLGGINGLAILSHEGLLKALKKMEDGKSVSQEEFLANLSVPGKERRFFTERKHVAERLVRTGMVRIGIELQCPTCQKRNWLSIKDADYSVQCHACFEIFAFPSEEPKKIKMAYRTFGPFSLPSRADGVYSVLLLLRFFTASMRDYPTTPMLSFTAQKGDKQIEVDLALLLQERKYGVSETRLIFAECKTENDFKTNDVKRMKVIAKEFPGAILVFATLKKSLSEKEKKIITPLVNSGRKLWKQNRPNNPVLILTGKELLSDFGPPECWREDPELKQFAERYQRSWDGLISLCDATQQIHLGMKPWREWLEERRAQNKKTKKVSP